jgi:hypothetical protein
MSWERALVSLTTFFEDAMTDKSFASEREMVLADVIENLVPEEKYYSFLQALKKIYGEEVFDGLDLDIGFAKDAMEIEDSSLNKTSNTESDENNSTTEESLEVPDDKHDGENSGVTAAKSTEEAAKEEL